MRVLVTLLAVAAHAGAQTSLSLRDAVERALQSHPALAASAARVSASSSLVNQAGLRPNPRLVLQTENWRTYGTPGFRANEDPDTYAYLTQPIETASKRLRRVEAARAEQRRAALERELLEKQISARVKQAYWNAAGAARVHELWVENAGTFRQIVEYHEHRVREGAMAEADLLKVRLEGERLAVAANTAALEAERARIDLLRQTGAVEFPELRLTEALEPGPEPPAASVERALEERTEVKLARQAVEQARARLRLEQAAAKPDLDLSFGYKRAGGFHTAYGGVQLPLPLFNRNQGSIGAVEAEGRAAESELAAAQALVRAEVRAARAEVEMRRTQVTRILKSALDRAEESARIAKAAYQEGGADLLRLLDAERVRIELEVLNARSLAEYRQSVVALETAMGVNP
ncbi:MAG: TolC family protein [Bryobacteraceae bacterium]